MWGKCDDSGGLSRTGYEDQLLYASLYLRGRLSQASIGAGKARQSQLEGNLREYGERQAGKSVSGLFRWRSCPLILVLRTLMV